MAEVNIPGIAFNEDDSHFFYTRAGQRVIEGTLPPRVKRSPGVYAWYFREVPPHIMADDCLMHENLYLLYVGISPTSPPQNGKPPESLARSPTFCVRWMFRWLRLAFQGMMVTVLSYVAA